MTAALDKIRGYVVVFGAISNPIDDETANGHPFFETIDAAATVHWLRSRCHLNLAHRPSNAIAHTHNGTLRVWRDATGIAFESDIPRTTEGIGWRNMLASRHDWGGSGYFAWYGRQVEGEGAARIERVTRCELQHVSITASPAYPATAAWLASTPSERMSPHIRASARRWNLGKRAPVEDPVPNPEFRADCATRTWIRMSEAERCMNYQDLCAIAARARTWCAA